MIIDTHAHYDDNRFDNDRDELLSNLNSNGIEAIIEASASVRGCRETINLINKYDNVYGMLGIHPDEVGDITDSDISFIKDNLSNNKIVSIGEIGLDYFTHEDEVKDKEEQKKWFEFFLDLAKEYNMPINVHSRDACEDTLNILSQDKYKGITGIIHCFSYSLETAQSYVNLDYYIGVGGVVTFKNGKKLKEVVQGIDLSRIVLETDCPYLAPSPFRGERNDSRYIRYIAATIGDIKGVDIDEVIKITSSNAKQIYGMK